MTNLLNTILANIEIAIAIVTALGALIYTTVREYNRIRKAIAEKDFMALAAPISAIVEKEPLKVLNNVMKPPIDVTPLAANTNQGKALIVAQAAIEQAQKEKPSILKTLGITSAVDAVPIVSGLYGIIKPLVKK